MVAALDVPNTVYKIPREVILSYNSKKRIGNYLIGRSIGEGAFAKVKEGMHVVTGEKVAIKIIDKTKAKQDSYLWKNLRREVKLLQCMRHPNVVGLYESLETEVAYYLVLELIRGGEMKDYISKAEKLNEEEAKKYMRQLLSAVWHIHSAGVVHRDLKVENIMLSKTGNIKIIDFGLSNCVKALESKGGRGTQCGSPAYAAPELLANKGYDKRVDIWAVGVNMFAMLVGKLPFKVKPFNLKKLYQKMVTGDMEILPPGTTQDARDLLTRLLQPDPNDRISLRECATHAWLADAPTLFINSPNFPLSEELNQEVLSYMEEYHNANVHSLILDLLTHSINSNTATYHHMANKFKRYLLEQNKILATIPDNMSTVSSFHSMLSEGGSKKEISSKKGSKTRVMKRRAKTACSTVKRVEQDVTAHSQSSTLKARRNSVTIARKTDRKTERKTSLPASTKEAFSGKPTTIVKLKNANDQSSNNHKVSPSNARECLTSSSNKDSSNQKDDSGFYGSRKSTGVVSCKSRIEALDPTKSRNSACSDAPRKSDVPRKSDSIKPRQYCHNENSSRDGKVNWRSVIKTKYCLNNNIMTTANSVHFQTRAPATALVELRSNNRHFTSPTSGIQWPLLRNNSARSIPDKHSGIPDRVVSAGGVNRVVSAGGVNRVVSDERVSRSYRWKSELYRTKMCLNKNTTPVYNRNISLPEHIHKPQCRTYSFR